MTSLDGAETDESENEQLARYQLPLVVKSQLATASYRKWSLLLLFHDEADPTLPISEAAVNPPAS
jgi:hypothetical protein